MIVTADQKRRIVLPKLVQPGDALDVSVSGRRVILHLLQRPTALPPTAPHALKPKQLAAIDLDEPAFLPVTDESPA
jgi:hypothetical protein